ncbi:MAG: NADH-quinone oxidoreductase subunit NuoG [Nitrospirae bacterium]|nr:NADH-quinone oxidoreductase subunit NuoG [Nitrospirota bacterium]
MSDQLTLTIDGREVAVPKGTLIVEAARRAGIEIPVFCYHPKLKPAGNCRMCLVEVAKAPKLQTACTTEAAEGMVVSTQSPAVQKAQEGVLELLLINHPLDCPVCDKGGECPLQNQTFRWGPGKSRFVEEKRRFEKPVSLGPHILLDRERCILCMRCVRFMDEIARHPQLASVSRGDMTYIDTAEGAVFDSPYSGNTIEICPVGALTGKAFRFQGRPWEYQRVPSVCPFCACGCNISLDVRGNRILRVVAREHPEVDDGWLCDRGRFNYASFYGEDRLREPLLRRNGTLQPATWEEALRVTADRFRAIKQETGGEALAGIGSSQMTNEEAYLFQKFFRTALGSPHVDHRLARAPSALAGLMEAAKNKGIETAMIPDLDQADAIFLLGCDIGREAPILDLRVKKAVSRGAQLIVAHSLTPPPAPPAARRIVILAGLAAVEEGAGLDPVVEFTLSLANGEPGRARLALVPPEANVYGLAAMGMLPTHLPGFVPVDDAEGCAAMEERWGKAIPRHAGLSGQEILQALGNRVRGLYLVGQDPVGNGMALPEGAFLVVQDRYLTATARRADVVLPWTAPHEIGGTITNLEGRVQEMRRALRAPGTAKSVEEAIHALSGRLGAPELAQEASLAMSRS